MSRRSSTSPTGRILPAVKELQQEPPNHSSTSSASSNSTNGPTISTESFNLPIYGGRRTLRKRDQNTNYTEPSGVIPYREEETERPPSNGQKKTSNGQRRNNNNTNSESSSRSSSIPESSSASSSGSNTIRSSSLTQLLSTPLNIDPTSHLPTLLPATTTTIPTEFPQTIDLHNAKIIDRVNLFLQDGKSIRKGDTVFLVCEPPSEPYYIGRVMGYQPKDTANHLPRDAKQEQQQTVEDAAQFMMRVNWFYRAGDLSKHSTDTRILYATMHSDLCPLDSYRGHVTVKHKHEIPDMDQYKAQSNTFWFDKLYDRYMVRFYDVIPTTTGLSGFPTMFAKALHKRYEFVYVESGKAAELLSGDSRRSCCKCGQWCSPAESIQCEECQLLYHTLCVGLTRRNCGKIWVCPSCCENESTQSDQSIPKEMDLYDQLGQKFLADDSGLSLQQRRDKEEWSYRYIGIHTSLEDCLDLQSAPYPRAVSRLGPKNQYTSMQEWSGHPVEYYDPQTLKAEFRQREEAKAASKKKRVSKKTRIIPDDPLYLHQVTDSPLCVPEKYSHLGPSEFPQWLQKRPQGFISRGGDDTAELLWEPNHISDEKVVQYISEQEDIAKALQLKVYSPNFMDAVLSNLLQSKYTTETARQLNIQLTRSKLKEPTFTEEEITRFENSVRINGSELHPVTKDVGTQPYGMIVRYYYLWKKTPNGREIWGNFPGRKKKKQQQQHQDYSPTKSKIEFDEGLVDELKPAQIDDLTHCKHCLSKESSKWYVAPPSTVPNHTQPKQQQQQHAAITNKDSSLALCSRCARLWYRYAVIWEEPLKVLKNLGVMTGNSVDFDNLLEGKRRKQMDWELVQDSAGAVLMKWKGLANNNTKTTLNTNKRIRETEKNIEAVKRRAVETPVMVKLLEQLDQKPPEPEPIVQKVEGKDEEESDHSLAISQDSQDIKVREDKEVENINKENKPESKSESESESESEPDDNDGDYKIHRVASSSIIRRSSRICEEPRANDIESFASLASMESSGSAVLDLDEKEQMELSSLIEELKTEKASVPKREPKPTAQVKQPRSSPINSTSNSTMKTRVVLESPTKIKLLTKSKPNQSSSFINPQDQITRHPRYHNLVSRADPKQQQEQTHYKLLKRTPHYVYSIVKGPPDFESVKFEKYSALKEYPGELKSKGDDYVPLCLQKEMYDNREEETTDNGDSHQDQLQDNQGNGDPEKVEEQTVDKVETHQQQHSQISPIQGSTSDSKKVDKNYSVSMVGYPISEPEPNSFKPSETNEDSLQEIMDIEKPNIPEMKATEHITVHKTPDDQTSSVKDKSNNNNVDLCDEKESIKEEPMLVDSLEEFGEMEQDRSPRIINETHLGLRILQGKQKHCNEDSENDRHKCRICFSPTRFTNVVKCTDCDLHVHLACYDIHCSIDSETVDLIESSSEKWYCDVCLNNKTCVVSSYYSCYLCQHSGMVIRQQTDSGSEYLHIKQPLQLDCHGKWFHLTCLLSITSRVPKITYEEAITNPQSNLATCQECMKPVEPVSDVSPCSEQPFLFFNIHGKEDVQFDGSTDKWFETWPDAGTAERVRLEDLKFHCSKCQVPEPVFPKRCLNLAAWSDIFKASALQLLIRLHKKKFPSFWTIQPSPKRIRPPTCQTCHKRFSLIPRKTYLSNYRTQVPFRSQYFCEDCLYSLQLKKYKHLHGDLLQNEAKLIKGSFFGLMDNDDYLSADEFDNELKFEKVTNVMTHSGNFECSSEERIKMISPKGDFLLKKGVDNKRTKSEENDVVDIKEILMKKRKIEEVEEGDEFDSDESDK